MNDVEEWRDGMYVEDFAGIKGRSNGTSQENCLLHIKNSPLYTLILRMTGYEK